MQSQGSFEPNKPLTLLHWLAALALFIFPLISTALQLMMPLPDGSGLLLFILFFGCIGFAFVLAIINGLPRWSFSYSGFVLTILVSYSLGILLWGIFVFPAWMLIFGTMDFWSLTVRLLYSGLMKAFTWLLVLLIAVILLALIRHWPKTHSLWKRVREDWTHLSFLLYGGVIFHIWLTFDEYHHENIWLFAAFANLAIGAWLYLRSHRKLTRILALVGGATGSLWLIAIAKWNLVPLQTWPVNLEGERIFEALAAIGNWIVTSLALIVPAIFRFLPSSTSTTTVEGIASR